MSPVTPRPHTPTSQDGLVLLMVLIALTLIAALSAVFIHNQRWATRQHADALDHLDGRYAAQQQHAICAAQLQAALAMSNPSPMQFVHPNEPISESVWQAVKPASSPSDAQCLSIAQQLPAQAANPWTPAITLHARARVQGEWRYATSEWRYAPCDATPSPTCAAFALTISQLSQNRFTSRNQLIQYHTAKPIQTSHNLTLGRHAP